MDPDLLTCSETFLVLRWATTLCAGFSLFLFRNLWLIERKLFPSIPLIRVLQPPLYLYRFLFVWALGSLAGISLFSDYSWYFTLAYLGWSMLLLALDENVWGPQISHFAVGSYLLLTGDLGVARIFSASMYMYGGLQKLNYQFVMTKSMTFFLSDLFERFGQDLSLLSSTVNRLMSVSSAMVEVFIGLGLLFPSTQFIAAIFGLTTHVVILLAVGPLGSNDYHGIWAWNVYCMVILWAIFIQFPPENGLLVDVAYELASGHVSTWIAVIVLAVCPAFSWFELWHAQLSFQLHSNNFPEIRIRFPAPRLLNGDIGDWIDQVGYLDIFGVAAVHGVCPAFSLKTGLEWSRYLFEVYGQQIQFTYKTRPAIFTGTRQVRKFLVTDSYKEVAT